MENKQPRGCLHERTEYKELPSGGYAKKCLTCGVTIESTAKPVTEDKGPKILTEDL